jgi:hypothetical protein
MRLPPGPDPVNQRSPAQTTASARPDKRASGASPRQNDTPGAECVSRTSSGAGCWQPGPGGREWLAFTDSRSAAATASRRQAPEYAAVPRGALRSSACLPVSRRVSGAG